MSDAAIHQPSPAKRGRGRGRGGAGRGGASARARGKPAAGRRGRAKVYDHPRAQAAHERQRDLKTSYATIASSMKPALEELADRNLDRLRSDFDAHKEVDQYRQITGFLDQRLEDRLADIERERRFNFLNTTNALLARTQSVSQGYQTTIADKVDGYYDTLLRRVDLLQEMFENGEPVDKLDDSYNYKSITTEDAAQQGIYLKIHKGVEVPYPQLHPELAQEANKPSDPSDQRTPSKRKVANQLDDEPILKRPSSLLTGTAIPPHIGGLLSATAPDEPPSQPPSPSPAASDDDDESSPPPDEPAPGRRGRKPKAPAANSGETPEVEAEQEPALPAGASEADEYGVRIITKRARGNDPGSSRIMVPALFKFGQHEIGFRGSSNDASGTGSKGKRKEHLDTLNPIWFQYDRSVGGYDCLTYEDGDLCKDTIKKHNLHPKYGLPLADSINEAEPPRPFVLGRRPTVFVSDNGKVQHTSRSVPAAKASDDMKGKARLMAALSQHLEDLGLTQESLQDEEYHRLKKERDERLAKRKQQEDAASQMQDREVFDSNVDLLVNACAVSDRQESAETQKSKPSQISSPAATRSREYDAVRDVLRDSEAPPAEPDNTTPIDNSKAVNLMLLSELALQGGGAGSANSPAPVSAPEPGAISNTEPGPVSRLEPAPQPSSVPGPVTGDTQELTIQMPEPVRPNQLRDPSELEQHGGLVKYTSDNPFLPEPLAPQLPQYTPREHGFAVQPSQHYQERKFHESPLARPDNFAYREPGFEQLPRQQLQPPQAQPFMNRQGSQASIGAESYGYGEPEAHYEPPQLRRPSQMSQEDQYAPARPNTEDVASLDPQTLMDPQLFESGQRPAASQLQAPQPEQVQQSQPPQSGGGLQPPQNSFFQTALNSPGVSPPQEHHQQPDYPEPPQAHQRFGTPMGASSRPPPATEGSPGRTPFSHPNGTDQQPLPVLRPLHRGSGPLMAPAPQAPAPRHIMMTPADPADDYPQPPPAQYYNHGYQSNGYAPPDQGTRSSGYIAQPIMHSSQQPHPPPYLQAQYPPPGHMGSQPPPQYEFASQPGQIVQSPPPFGNGPGGPPSPFMRGSSTPSSSRNKNNQYREIQPAPRMADVEDSNGSELRTLLYDPAQGIRDYQATALPPSHGPTQIRGWTHTTGSKKSRGKNSTDSQIDPSLGQGERK